MLLHYNECLIFVYELSTTHVFFFNNLSKYFLNRVLLINWYYLKSYLFSFNRLTCQLCMIAASTTPLYPSTRRNVYNITCMWFIWLKPNNCITGYTNGWNWSSANALFEIRNINSEHAYANETFEKNTYFVAGRLHHLK